MRITTKNTKKEGFERNPHPRWHSGIGFFQINPPVAGLNISNNISIPLVRVNIRENEHDTTFEIS